MPTRSAEFNHPLIPVVVETGSARLPADGSLLTVEPAGAVQLAALKPAGNPTAIGSPIAVDAESVTIRLVEITGAASDVEIATPIGTISDVVSADLLENPRTSGDPLRLHGYQIATLGARLDVAPVIDAGMRQLAPDAEAAQPLYARYWLHNRGPAPLGGLPAVAHLHPQALAAQPGDTVRLALSVASDCSDADVDAVVGLRYPSGWGEDPAVRMFGTRSYRLPARGHRETELLVTVPTDAEPGHYPVRAQLTLTGDVPPAWRQTVEDVCMVTVGVVETDLVRLVGEPADIVLSRGETARLTVAVGSGARADLALEAHLISPWGTWDWIGPAAHGAVLPAGSTVEVGFDVTPPPWLTPGQWWALIRVGCAGRLLYTRAASVTVR